MHRDKDEMARAAAARLITRIVDAQAARGTASVVLTGGRNGNGLLAALAASPARDAVDWSRLDLWWGDERFLPEGDPERNDTQAREALLDSVPVDPARVHAMAPSDGAYGDDVEAAAAAYAAELAAAPGGRTARRRCPPSTCCCWASARTRTWPRSSPSTPVCARTERTVVGVRGAPKPPPVRISLTLPAIRAAREVWLLAAGEDKADAAALALSGADADAGTGGRARTGAAAPLWLLDEAAAAQLPPERLS